MNLRNYILEVIKREIRTILYEKTATDSLTTLDDLIHTIVSDANNENLDKKTYQFSENNIVIPIEVRFNKDAYYGSCDIHGWFGPKIYVYIESNPDFWQVKSIVGHELIHFIDNVREKDYDKKYQKYQEKQPGYYGFAKSSHINGYDYVPCGDYRTVKENCPISEAVNDILYRLWSRTERNAYVTISYQNMKNCYEYIKMLEDEINEIEQSNTEENALCWIELHKVLYYCNEIKSLKPHINFDSDISINRCRKYFIKKSRYLLNKFSKKLLKNCMNNTYKKHVTLSV
jgi:hypothetical protein